MVCISRPLAESLGLTWVPCSAALVGVGGVGGALGESDQRINFRLGGCERACATNLGPLEGCFTINVRPIIMTDKLVDTIGHKVLLGQTFLRYCLGSVDQLGETLDISPAFLKHGCTDFRVSIPCVSSKSAPEGVVPTLVSWLSSDKAEDSIEEYLGMGKPTLITKVATAASAIKDSVTHVVNHALSNMSRRGKRKPRSPRNEDDSSSAGSDQGPAAPAGKPVGKKPKPRKQRSIDLSVAAPMHPGFPQSGNIPTPEERERHLQQMTDRARGEQDQAALIARDNIPMLETRARTLGQGSKDRIPPMAVCYSLEALQRSGRLIDGLSLDISGPTANMANQLADIRSQLARELRLDLHDMLKRQGYGGVVPPTVPIPSRSAPPASIPSIVRVDSRAVPDTTARPVVPPNPSTPEAQSRSSPLPADNTPPIPESASNPSPSRQGEAAPSSRTARFTQPPAPSSHTMRTRRQEQEGTTPTNGAATTAVANVSQITDHLGYTVPESWYRLKGGVPLSSVFRVTAPVRVVRRPLVGRRTFAMTCLMLLLCSLCLCSVGAAAQPDDATGVVEPAWSNVITLEEDSAWWLQVCALFVYWIVACLVWGTYPLIPPRYQNYLCIHLGSIGIVLLQQLLHIKPALANTWLSLIRYGWATHFVIASTCLTLMFAYAWHFLEHTLHARAKRL
jgi:hypothetical protein